MPAQLSLRRLLCNADVMTAWRLLNSQAEGFLVNFFPHWIPEGGFWEPLSPHSLESTYGTCTRVQRVPALCSSGQTLGQPPLRLGELPVTETFPYPGCTGRSAAALHLKLEKSPSQLGGLKQPKKSWAPHRGLGLKSGKLSAKDANWRRRCVSDVFPLTGQVQDERRRAEGLGEGFLWVSEQGPAETLPSPCSALLS